MAKVAAEKYRQPSPVWTVDPLLLYPAGSQDPVNCGVDNAAFYDNESVITGKIPTVQIGDNNCQKKRTSTWENENPPDLPKKKRCSGRLAFLLLTGIVLFVLVVTIAIVAYLAVGEVRITWGNDEEIDNMDAGISLIEGRLRITNRVFTKDLINMNSQAFHQLTAQVKQSMDAVFIQSGLGPYYNETSVLGYTKGSVIVRCRVHLSIPRIDATHQVGMAVIQALERYHGYLPGGLLQLDIRSLHFTGLLSADDSSAEVLRLPRASWGVWSMWTPCLNLCEMQSRFRECFDEQGRKLATPVNGTCGVEPGTNREVRRCPCKQVLSSSTTTSSTTTEQPARPGPDEECAGDCEEGQICLLLPQTAAARCLVPRDINDPTGCGGWCVGDHQLCHEIENSTYQCVDNPECSTENNEWRCGNGLCIPKTARCDGQFNCYDMSDEFNCDCEDNKFRCGKNTSCLPLSVQCNGRLDCWDGSDELNCTLRCPTNQYTCNDGHCIDKQKFCDGFPDCSDRSDEPEGCNAPCLHTQNQCRNGRCVSSALWCNGVDNCGDETDEIGCDPPRLIQKNGQ